ncbi:response regulator transcription factor [Arthrobacter pascens]|uniref:response regulator transcription factor n=1 Tax=Arthrobacter pascens TaxID=1677 RepID=UPI00196A42E8|nr:response regulator transcription factor [Arthrobacter pascens]MBN3497568.1 response regulator transcription factor [Arthrobacter pascens]
MNDRRVVVVIEQDQEVCALLCATLGEAGFEVHCSDNGEAGLALVRAKQPDTVTLNAVLPDADGLEVARRIREFSHAYLLVVSASSDLAATVQAFDAGADDYLVTPLRPRELRVRVDGMLRRPRQLRPEHRELSETVAEAVTRCLEHNGLEVDAVARSVRLAGRTLELTKTEFDLLLIILEQGKRVVTKAELARHLQLEDLGPGRPRKVDTDRVIEVHIGNLRRKLGDDARSPKWLKTVRGLGYTLT